MSDNLSPLSFDGLVVIDAIERRGSFAAAAEELNKVPSALSYVVQKLEEQLNVTLFEKQGRKAVLTPAGRYLLEEGRLLLNAARALKDRTQSLATGWETRIRVAIDAMQNTDVVFNAIKLFLDEHPSVEFDVREEVMNGGWEALIHDDIDLLVGGSAPIPTQKGIATLAFSTLDRTLAVSPKHPLARAKQPIPSEQLKDHRVVVVHDSAKQAVGWTRGLLAESNAIYVPSMWYKIKAQIAGLGYGFLSEKEVAPFIENGQLVEIDIQEKGELPDFTKYIAWKITNKGQGLKRLREILVELQKS